MDNSFQLEIFTPEQEFFKGKAQSVTVETSQGRVEILAEHMPIVIGLISSAIVLIAEGQTLNIVNGKGFLQVHDNTVTLFCQTAEWEQEVEQNKLRKVSEAAKRRDRERQGFIEYKNSKAQLSRLMEKLNVKNR